MASFSKEEKEKIRAFKEAVEEYNKGDTSLELTRWLIARKWDHDAAVSAYINSMKWREKEKIDTILEWFPETKHYAFLSEYWPLSLLPTQHAPPLRTNDGYQVIFERLGAMSPHIVQVAPKDDLMNFHFYIQELTAKERKKVLFEEKDGSTYCGAVFIQDLHGLSMGHLSSQIYHLLSLHSSYDSNNYPETIRRVYFINTPSVFSYAWKMAKKLIDPVTLERVVILGSNYQEELKKVIPPDSLPKEYGGELDYLPKGGGSIKELLHQHNPTPKMQKTDIAYSFSVTVKVPKGAHLGWQFKTKHYDISFSLFFHETEDGERTTVLEAKREESHKGVIEGVEQANDDGYFTLFWDNSYSWTRSKHLKYLIFLEDEVVDEKTIVAQVKT
uniref:CRAL-TRIO domain-containing protein n=1 Tax=Arcella intermedia TaxID=1963864 RepID=A0A6B2L6M4_9EUKA